MSKLRFYETAEIDQLASPQDNQNISLNEPAIKYLTDYSKVSAAVIDSDMCALEVKKMMLQSHTKMKFVVDANDKLLGIVSLSELSELALIQKTSKSEQASTIPITDMMIPKSDLMAFDYHEVETASVRDVIDALKDSGQHHCLVLERETHKIRGIFSSNELSRRLHVPIDIAKPSTFFSLFKALSH